MTFSTVFFHAATKCSHSMTRHLLKVLLNIDDKLAVIESKLTKIQNGDYNSGIEYLKQASIENTAENIERARSRFHDSAGHVDNTIEAMSYFFEGCCNELLGNKRTALYNYTQAFRAACKYEITHQFILVNREVIIKRINMGVTGVGATAGAAATTYGVLFWGLLAGGVSWPAVASMAAIGMVIGGSPFYLTTKAGQYALKFYQRDGVRQADEFYNNFTTPLASLIIEQGYSGPANDLICEVIKGNRSDITKMEQVIRDQTKWPAVIC